MTNNKYALVTGGSSGIGLAFSRRLAELGHNILLVSNQRHELEIVASELHVNFGIKTATLFIDLARQEAAQEVFDFCQQHNFEVEILINNAGIFYFKYIYETDISLINKILSLHIITPALMVKLFSKSMIERKNGYIMNISSIAAWMKFPGIAFYGATKAFVRNISMGIGEEFCRSNVSITVVCPGAVATDLYNLSSKYQRLGIRLGIIIPPEKLAKRAIKKMFKRRKQYIPSPLVNRSAIWLCNHLPHFLIQAIKQKIDNSKW
jgi:short-subunit dehydrogenase